MKAINIMNKQFKSEVTSLILYLCIYSFFLLLKYAVQNHVNLIAQSFNMSLGNPEIPETKEEYWQLNLFPGRGFSVTPAVQRSMSSGES